MTIWRQLSCIPVNDMWVLQGFCLLFCAEFHTRLVWHHSNLSIMLSGPKVLVSVMTPPWKMWDFRYLCSTHSLSAYVYTYNNPKTLNFLESPQQDSIHWSRGKTVISQQLYLQATTAGFNMGIVDMYDVECPLSQKINCFDTLNSFSYFG